MTEPMLPFSLRVALKLLSPKPVQKPVLLVRANSAPLLLVMKPTSLLLVSSLRWIRLKPMQMTLKRTRMYREINAF